MIVPTGPSSSGMSLLAVLYRELGFDLAVAGTTRFEPYLVRRP